MTSTIARARSHRLRAVQPEPVFNPLKDLTSLDLWLRSDHNKVSTGGSRQYTSSASEYHSRADNAAFDVGTGDFLFSFHVYRDASAAEAVLSKREDANNRYTLGIDSSDKVDFIAVVGGATKIRIQGNTALSSSAWHHIVVLCDRSATGGCKVYLNGSDDTAGTPTTSTDDCGNTGAFQVGRDGNTVYTNGRIARVAKGSVTDVTSIESSVTSSLYNSAAGVTWAELSPSQRTDYGFTSGNGVFYIGNEPSGTLTDSVNSLDLADNNTVTTATGPANSAGGGDVADGDPVMQMTDRSSNAKVFAQSTRASQPQWNESDANFQRKPTITFDGTDDCLKHTAGYPAGTEGLFWAVVRPTSFSDNPRILASSDEGTSTSRLGISVKTSGTKLRVRHQNAGGTADDILGSTTLSTDTVYIIVVTSNESSYAIRVNGNDETEVVSGGGDNGKWFGDTTLRDNVVLGALNHTGVGQYFVGQIAEVGVCSDENSSEISNLEVALAARYGVTLS